MDIPNDDSAGDRPDDHAGSGRERPTAVASVLFVIVLVAGIALPWWSWHEAAARADDRSQVRRDDPAALPDDLCGGYVDGAAVAAMPHLRHLDRSAVEPKVLASPDAGRPNMSCELQLAERLRIDVRPVEETDPAWAVVDNSRVPATLADGPRPSVAGPDQAWTTAPCPGLGPDRYVFARAVVLDKNGLPGREFEKSTWSRDERVELAALAAGALDKVAARAGCQIPAGQATGIPPYPQMPQKRGVPGTPPDPLCAQAKYGAGKGVPPEQPDSVRSWVPDPGTSQGTRTTPVASCDLAVGGDSARQTITTFRGSLVTIGTNPAGAREEALTGKRLNNTFTTRTEAVCGGERVTWSAELRVFGNTPDAKQMDAANAEAQAQFKAFVDLNVRGDGCQVTGSGTGVSG